MSTTPTNEDGAAAAAADGGDIIDWRSKVQQSYRNNEVRQIAKVLASLEPGASEASKLRLAMQFEDAVFKQASALADYHKRLTKRLKKLQKTYVPSTTDGDGSAAAAAAASDKERQIQDLIRKYGTDLDYVVTNSKAAVKEMREKYGEEKAVQLQQHIDGVKLWATDLGIAISSSAATTANNASSKNPMNRTPKPNYTMSTVHLEKLTSHLEKRLPNVRSHVVKLVHPDTFLQESLQKMQDEFKDKGRVVRVQAENMRKRYEQYQQGLSSSSSTLLPASSSSSSAVLTNPEEMLARALEQADMPVPYFVLTGGNTSNRRANAANNSTSSPTVTGGNAAAATSAGNVTPRTANTKLSQSELDSRVRAALLHLQKMRATSSIVLAYLCAPDKYIVPSTALAKAHTVAIAGIEVVQDVMREHRLYHQSALSSSSSSGSSSSAQLQDAWLKALVVPIKTELPDALNDIPLDDAADDDGTTSAVPAKTTATTATERATSPARKRIKLSSHHQRLVLRSRVLLTPGRAVPSGFAGALQSKGCTLVRPFSASSGAASSAAASTAGSYVQLQFEDAFVMTIYLVPLLVTLRATTTSNSNNVEEMTTTTPGAAVHKKQVATPNMPTPTVQCAQWTPLHQGLAERGNDLLVGGLIKGSYETVGFIVQERLRDASAHATHALRTCFTNAMQSAHTNTAATATTGGTGDFDVEMLEASALLEFIQLSRDTYTPNWSNEVTDKT